ncbi:MAG: hypothetical protein L3J46_10060, partial [Kangiellaceae bacterium]|nr:hypothetical protein [Kangiellaceae bacterium]
KYNGKIICFIRIKDSRYRSSYCGAVDPLSTTFYYRTTNKSPDDSKSKKIHKDLEGLFNNFTKKYQAYKREDRMVAEF